MSIEATGAVKIAEAAGAVLYSEAAGSVKIAEAAGSISTLSTPSLWTPVNITTSLWLDASDSGTITESGGLVSQWDDKSGNDNHATQDTGSKQPSTGVNTQNVLNVLTFDGARCIESAGLSVTQPSAVFMIARSSNLGTSGRSYIFDGRINNSFRNLLAIEGNSTNLPSIWAGTGWRPHADSSDTNYHEFEGFFDGNSSVISVDADRDTVSLSPGSRDMTSGIMIGSNYTCTGDFLTGDIGEVVVVDYELTTDDRQKLEGYLAWRWGIAANLPVGHPYKNSAPEV